MTSDDRVTDTQADIDQLPISEGKTEFLKPPLWISKKLPAEPLDMSYPGTTASTLSNRMKMDRVLEMKQEPL